MRIPQLYPKPSHWQVLVMDPEGRWIHRFLDETLMKTARIGEAAHLGLEAEDATRFLLQKRDA